MGWASFRIAREGDLFTGQENLWIHPLTGLANFHIVELVDLFDAQENLWIQPFAELESFHIVRAIDLFLNQAGFRIARVGIFLLVKQICEIILSLD